MIFLTLLLSIVVSIRLIMWAFYIKKTPLDKYTTFEIIKEFYKRTDVKPLEGDKKCSLKVIGLINDKDMMDIANAMDFHRQSNANIEITYPDEEDCYI